MFHGKRRDPQKCRSINRRVLSGADLRKRCAIRPITFEPLERRELLALSPLTFADSSFWGDSAFGQSTSPSISADGQLVVFESSATNIVPSRYLSPDGFNTNNVYLYNRATSSVNLVSQDLSGNAAGGGAFTPLAKISPSGRYVVFGSDAPNLAANLLAGNSNGEFYLRDLETGVTTAITSMDSISAPDFFFSANSNALFFVSKQTTLTADPIANFSANLFRRDLTSGLTQLVSVSINGVGVGVPTTTNPAATASADGRFVAFVSADGTLTPNDNNGLPDVFVRDMATGQTTLVSVNSAGTGSAAGNSGIVSPVITPDGSKVAFVSTATNLVSGVNNLSGGSVLFVRDLLAGATRAISVRSDNTVPTANAVSELALSGDGTTLAFVDATIATTGLLPETTYTGGTFRADVYVTYLDTPSLNLVSQNAQSTASGNGSSGLVSLSNAANPSYKLLGPELAISADGRYVYFVSAATDLVSGLTLAGENLYRRCLLCNVTELVSSAAAGSGPGNGESFEPAISTDGNTVVFASLASNLIAGDKNQQDDIFLRDMTAGATSLVSARSPQLPSAIFAGGQLASVSADGTAVLFTADASVVAQGLYAIGLPNNGDAILVRNVQTGALAPVNVAPDGKSIQPATNPVMSADGKSVAFLSGFPFDGAAPVSNGEFQLYVRRLDAGQTKLLSPGTSNQGANASISDMTISSDGRYVAFVTSATNLVAGFINAGPGGAAGNDNIYLWDRQQNSVVLVSHAPAAIAKTGNDLSYGPVFSPDGTKLAFTSKATDLVGGLTDANSAADLFVYDIATGAISAASTLAPTTTANAASGDLDSYSSGSIGTQRPSFNYRFSSDARYLVFESFATNLVAGSGDVNNTRDIFRRDLTTGNIVLVTTDGVNATHTTLAAQPIPISDNAQRIAFLQQVTVSGGGGGAGAEGEGSQQVDAVFVRDLALGATTLVSSVAGQPAVPSSGFASQVAISPDGTLVTFLASGANDVVPDLIPSSPSSFNNLFLRNLSTGITSLVTPTVSGTDFGTLGYGTPLLFSSGGTLFFQSSASYFPSDRNAATDVFAFTAPGNASIRGTVYSDVNSSGALDDGEQGLPLWLIYLDTNTNGQLDSTEPVAQTDPGGNYAFLNLAAGNYKVSAKGLPQYLQTAPAGGVYSVSLTTGLELVLAKDFGFHLKTNSLAVTSVTAPASAAAGRSINVSWTVLNGGDEEAGASWQDAIYFSTTPTPGPENKLLATIPRNAGLAAHGSYTQSASIDVPAALPGDYFLLVQTSRRSLVPPAAVGLASGSAPISVSVPTISFSQPVSGNFDHPGQTLYYQLDVNAGDSFTVTASGAAAPTMQLSAGAERLPNKLSYDATAVVGQPLLVPAAKSSKYFVAAGCSSAPQSPPAFTLSTAIQGLTVQSIEQKSGSNNGRVTIVIHGTQLYENEAVSLVLGSTVIPAAALHTVDSSLMHATFDLTGAPLGNYSLQIKRGTETATLSSTFSIIAGAPGKLEVSLTIPPVIRPRAPKPANIVLNYANTGDTDITLPMVKIVESGGGNLNYLLESTDGGAEMNILPPPIKPGLAVLPPHTSGQVTLYYLPAVSQNSQVTFDLFASTFDDPQFASQTLDWADISVALRPAGVTDADWEAFIASERARYGDTYGSLYEFLVSQIQAPISPDITQMAFVNGQWRFHLSTQPYYDGITSVDPERGVVPTPKPCPPMPTPVMNQGKGDGVQQVHVLILGANDYQHARDIGIPATNLYGAVFDANDLASLFAKTYNVPDVDLRTDEVARKDDDDNLNRDKILQAIKDTVAKGDGDDITLIIDSSHGLPGLPGVGPGGLVTPRGEFVTAADLNGALQGAQGPTVFISDACYSGNFMPGVNVPNVIPVATAGCNEKASDDSFIREFMREAQRNPNASIADLLRRAGLDQNIKNVNQNRPPQNAQFKFPPGFNPKIERPDSKKQAVKQMKGPPSGQTRSVVVRSFDPNELEGTAGYGDQHFVKADLTLANFIRFENDPLKANAPAQEVFVSQQLSSNLDWSTFELGSIQFGSTAVDFPPGLQSIDTSIGVTAANGSTVGVIIAASLDQQTGIVKWSLQSVDPRTGQLPLDPLSGFLPVDDANHSGQGSLQYFVKPKSGLATGTQILAQASIVFDTNNPLATNTFINTIDAGGPTSKVTPLVALQNRTFTLKWSGADDVGGSGIGTYDIFVSDNNGPYTLFKEDIAATSTSFTGIGGHTYRFYSVATDNVGHEEEVLATFDAQTTLTTHPWYNAPNPLDADNNGQVAPLDALVIINYLNAGQPISIPPTAATGGGPGFLDTNANDEVAPLDALLVINGLNAGLGEGEPQLDSTMAAATGPDPVSEFANLIALLASDLADLAPNKRRKV